jgi:outer membrane protein OmpA-like peptidoglycan-associated protein
LLIAVFVLGGINFEKNMGYFFLILLPISFFILGIKIGAKSNFNTEAYHLLLNKEQEINRLDDKLLLLENQFTQLEEESLQGNSTKSYEIVFFENGSTELSDFNKKRIQAFVSKIEKCQLNVNGFTDETGIHSLNKDVSVKRAQNVANYIKSLNRPNITINKTKGFGDDNQLAEGKNEISRSKNRRATIEIIDWVRTEQRKNLLNEIHNYRTEIQEIKIERDSLRKLIYKLPE